MSSAAVLRLTEIEDRGRGLTAAQPLKAGEIVLRDSPLLLYSALPFICPNNTNNKKYCSHCFTLILPSSSSSSSSFSVSCPSCSHVFCSLNCLSVSISSSHSTWACESLRRLRDSTSLSLHQQPLELQLQARFLVAAYNLALVSTSKFHLLLSLQGQPNPNNSPHSEPLHSLIASLCPPPIEGFSLELSSALLTKDKLNAFGLMEPFNEQDGGDRSVRAYGIYPMASFFNHDCLPNACRFDYVDYDSDKRTNTDIIVRMIHDVPEGREICLSYFPVNLNYSARQRRLSEDYGFTCLCDRCKVESNWSDNDDNENDDDEAMDENEEEVEDDSTNDIADGGEEEDRNFPHAYFFVRYMCNRRNCWGTLAPLPPKDDATPSNVFECNVCGKLRNDEEDDADAGEDGISMDE